MVKIMQVLLRPIALKYFERLNEPDKSRVKACLDDLEQEPPKGDILPITGQTGYFRARVSNYRILFRFEDDAIFVTNIDPRGQAYKKKNRGKR
jgi:mRNA-degrading endonuclease RelE of RelBE toxin-antitoxin system